MKNLLLTIFVVRSVQRQKFAWGEYFQTVQWVFCHLLPFAISATAVAIWPFNVRTRWILHPLLLILQSRWWPPSCCAALASSQFSQISFGQFQFKAKFWPLDRYINIWTLESYIHNQEIQTQIVFHTGCFFLTVPLLRKVKVWKKVRLGVSRTT